MNKIATSMPSIMPVDGLLFRDTAFPQGGWLLRDLLDEKNRTRIAQQLQVDYLVLVGPFEYTKGDWTGPTIVIAGADTKVHKASLSATIYDLRAGTPIARIVSTALGNELLFSYVILMSGSTPHVVTPMLDAMVKAIAETISKAHPHASTRIAVLAAEMPEPNK